ncbi:MAG TPA: Mut7-C RNAse domain-containing protein [Syntrophobacteraceae bacterium]|nr:Mut7-C RNAse domain-containing protein [Syntrophobacteraceae bacterium]
MTQRSEKHFATDGMLGKLAKWLRILGFDARCEQLKEQHQIDAYRSHGFWVVTRNRRWSGQSGVYCLAANDPLEQLREMVHQIPVTPHEIRLLQRCIRCNGPIEKMTREDAFGSVPDFVYETHTSFHRCPACGKIYWPGTHAKRIRERLQTEFGWHISEDFRE